jgi:peptidoglycan/LPS O-acetylase OafA/YrhL
MILLDLNSADDRPIYGQIADRVKFAVAGGVLLDFLPIDRRVVWMGKVSFALVTTLALALLLLAMAAVSTEEWKPQESLSIAEALSFGMIVLVALGWGCFGRRS